MQPVNSYSFPAAHCFHIDGKSLKPENLRVGLGKLFGSFYQDENTSIMSSVSTDYLWLILGPTLCSKLSSTLKALKIFLILYFEYYSEYLIE